MVSWLMGHTRRASAMCSDPAHQATDETNFKRTSSACRHPGGVTVAARGLLAEPRAPGSEATWERVEAKFPDEDPASISEATTAAVAASVSGFGGSPKWRPENDFGPQAAFKAINSRNALSGTGSNIFGLQSIHRTGFGCELVLRPSGGDLSTVQAPSRRSSGSSFCKPTPPPWGKTAAPYA